MKFSTVFQSAILLPVLLLLQNAQPSQGAQFLLPPGEDGEENPLAGLVNDLICYAIPCSDESLGWRNVFGPIAADAEGTVVQEQGTPVVTTSNNAVGAQEETSELRDQLRKAGTNLFWSFLTNQLTNNNGGGNRKLRGLSEEEKIKRALVEEEAVRQATSM